MEKTFFIIIIAIILFNFLLERLLDYLNLKNWSNELPEELKGIYDAEKYRKSQDYFKANSNLAVITSTVSLLMILAMLFFKGFAFVDSYARSVTDNPILIALLFFGILGIASDLIGTIFSVYSTFVIEEKFGFNKTTVKTFILDKIKGYIMAAIIGGGLLSLIIWIYQSSGEYFWLFAWGVISLFSIFATMFYASVILPLFNKLTPLEEGELRTAIESYCNKVRFKLDNLFIMDGSKRSSKANAFFSGLGAKKKIVLFDTLIEKQTTEELVGVIAHEIGHYKKKHTLTSVVLSIAQMGLMLFIMSLFLSNPDLSKALGVEQPSFHIGILAFGLLYSPLSMLMGIGMSVISRKNEFEADRFAAETYAAKPLQDALKKLSVDSLSNLKPHPAYVFVHYSHPPLLERLKALDAIK